MGMFDREVQLTKAIESGDVPTAFRIERAEYLGTVKSADYGENTKARVWVGDKNGEVKTFVVFGVMADQISRMDAGDLPATVRIEKDGRANVFARAESV